MFLCSIIVNLQSNMVSEPRGLSSEIAMVLLSEYTDIFSARCFVVHRDTKSCNLVPFEAAQIVWCSSMKEFKTVLI
jgi:hypothetical protein